VLLDWRPHRVRAAHEVTFAALDSRPLSHLPSELELVRVRWRSAGPEQELAGREPAQRRQRRREGVYAGKVQQMARCARHRVRGRSAVMP
jgi:hypothetical protein